MITTLLYDYQGKDPDPVTVEDISEHVDEICVAEPVLNTITTEDDTPYPDTSTKVRQTGKIRVIISNSGQIPIQQQQT